MAKHSKPNRSRMLMLNLSPLKKCIRSNKIHRASEALDNNERIGQINSQKCSSHCQFLVYIIDKPIDQTLIESVGQYVSRLSSFFARVTTTYRSSFSYQAVICQRPDKLFRVQAQMVGNLETAVTKLDINYHRSINFRGFVFSLQ